MTMDLNVSLMLNNTTTEDGVLLILKSLALGILAVWTVIANCLVFVVLYKNPRLQTVPNLLVGNLAFSDLCLGLMVLPFSAVYAVVQQWLFGKITCELWLSTDILCCTASIWNLSMIGLDRYWAITAPIKYMNKRTKKTALIMIASVWALSLVISIAPFLGWRTLANKENYIYDSKAANYQCTFMDLPTYTIYSATGSFFVPTAVMLFVYYRIYRAFAEHKARQIYRQKVIRKHIESTILHDISHVLPTSDEFDREKDNESDSNKIQEESVTDPPIPEEDEGVAGESIEASSSKATSDAERRSSGYESPQSILDKHREDHQPIPHTKIPTGCTRSSSDGLEKVHQTNTLEVNGTSVIRHHKKVSAPAMSDSSIILCSGVTKSSGIEDNTNPTTTDLDTIDEPGATTSKKSTPKESLDETLRLKRLRVQFKRLSKTSMISMSKESATNISMSTVSSSRNDSYKKRQHHKSARAFKSSIKKRNNPITYERVFRHKNRKERNAMLRKSLQEKPRSISAAKEKRGVKVLGIILGCFLVCWTPFFIMYLVVEFHNFNISPHIEQFITWLGYSNSAMNPIIYTVFNRDYQNALKRLFLRKNDMSRRL